MKEWMRTSCRDARREVAAAPSEAIYTRQIASVILTNHDD
jgi:hypothetical protein